ncbi:hypothetical protein LZ30DRAFT_707432 [Colletotrichum cereale]|nr:hypothetical protein LZ30DRAFT_707432 [Colletotrichum cereale]
MEHSAGMEWGCTASPCSLLRISGVLQPLPVAASLLSPSTRGHADRRIPIEASPRCSSSWLQASICRPVVRPWHVGDTLINCSNRPIGVCTWICSLIKWPWGEAGIVPTFTADGRLATPFLHQLLHFTHRATNCAVEHSITYSCHPSLRDTGHGHKTRSSLPQGSTLYTCFFGPPMTGSDWGQLTAPNAVAPMRLHMRGT